MTRSVRAEAEARRLGATDAELDAETTFQRSQKARHRRLTIYALQTFPHLNNKDDWVRLAAAQRVEETHA